jgi:hypothetical protein
MEHSKNFDKVKKFYATIYMGQRTWDEARVKNAVEKGWITSEEYEEIVGQPYKA